MLTKKDFKQIREILKEELEPVKSEIGDIKRAADLREMRIHKIIETVERLESLTGKISLELKKINKKLLKITNYFDKLWIKTSQEIQRIKEFVNMSF